HEPVVHPALGQRGRLERPVGAAAKIVAIESDIEHTGRHADPAELLDSVGQTYREWRTSRRHPQEHDRRSPGCTERCLLDDLMSHSGDGSRDATAKKQLPLTGRTRPATHPWRHGCPPPPPLRTGP